MPISAQEWRVRTGLINAGRIRTVSIFRSSKPTVSASPASHAESAASVSNSDSVPGGGSGREIVACNDQPAPQTKREAGPCYSTFINELPSSTWPWKGWSSRALRFCLAAPSPLIPTLMTVLITVCQILIGTKGMLCPMKPSHRIKFYTIRP